MANKSRTFYVAYSFKKWGQSRIGACDVITSNKMNTANIKDFHQQIAESMSVPTDDLVITFFAELER